MRIRTILQGVMVVVLSAAATPLAAQHSGDHSSPFTATPATQLAWQAIEVPGFVSGMEIAVIRGDPGVEGEPYTIRLRFPDGYRFPPHWHPVAENLTVIEGTFLLAMGEEAVEGQLTTYRPGDYLYIAGRHPHFGGASGRTVIQLHGSGPFDIIVVGSPEDTR